MHIQPQFGKGEEGERAAVRANGGSFRGDIPCEDGITAAGKDGFCGNQTPVLWSHSTVSSLLSLLVKPSFNQELFEQLHGISAWNIYNILDLPA